MRRDRKSSRIVWTFCSLFAFVPIKAHAGVFDRAIGGFSDAVGNILDLRPSDVSSVKLGVGPGFSPAFEGSKDYKWHAVPVVSLKYRDVLKVNNNDIDFTAFDQVFDTDSDLGPGKFEFGPSVDLDFGRSEHDSFDLRGMGNIGFGFEVGAYVAYSLERAKIELDFGHDVAGGHGGGLADLNVSSTLYKDERWAVGANVTLTLATSKYLKSYFGVTQLQSFRSGLPIFHPSGGLKDVFLGISSSYELTPKWSLLAQLGYERLLGDAAASPLVQQRGDVNQSLTSVFIVYTF